MVKRIDVSYKLVLCCSVILATFFALTLFVSPLLAGALGVSASSAGTVVALINGYSTITFIISIIGIITGVGSIGAGIASTVLYLIKKQGKAKAALW